MRPQIHRVSPQPCTSARVVLYPTNILEGQRMMVYVETYSSVRGIRMKTIPAVDIKGSQAGTVEDRQDFCGTGPRAIGIVCLRGDCVVPRDAIGHDCMCCYRVATLALSCLCGVKCCG